MKKISLIISTFIFGASFFAQGSDLIISGAYDGPLTGGKPKGIELYVINDISDLSIYGVGSANNGGGSDGEEFTFPNVSVIAGTYIYISSEAPEFFNFFGFSTDYTSGSMSINGDDAIELFKNGFVIDVFGDINTDGTGEPWEFLDGWAYRNDLASQNNGIFYASNWSFSGTNVFDGETDNTTSPIPFPLGTYTPPSILPVELIGLNGQTYEKNNELTWTTVSEINNDYFTIEKSIDGIHYNKIGRVQGNGNSTSTRAYSFSDFEINTTLVYYKLTQVDFDGTKEDVGTLKMKREVNTVFSYPNPANNELNFTFNASYDGAIIIEYIDIQGKSISENVTVNANNSFKSTVFQTISSGLYFTRISKNGTLIQSMKIVKL